jgi:hypothetical protein
VTAESVLEPLAVALLAASLVGASTLAARCWGHSVGGVLSAFPLIVGPVLCLAAERHGTRFAAAAAGATLLGLVALAGFALVYAWAAARSGWTVSLMLAWVAAAALGAVAGRMDLSRSGPGSAPRSRSQRPAQAFRRPEPAQCHAPRRRGTYPRRWRSPPC